MNEVARIESTRPAIPKPRNIRNGCALWASQRDEAPHSDFIPDARKSLWPRYLYHGRHGRS